MKRLDEVLDIGPKYAALFQQIGIRSITDLDNAKDIQELSRSAAIPLELIQQWRDQAHQIVSASRYRRRFAIGVAGFVLLILGWVIASFHGSSLRLASRADALYKKGQYEQAIALYDKAIQKDPQYETAYANKGLALGGLQRYPEALAALTKAIELDPKDAWSYSQRAYMYSQLGKYEEAVLDYDKAIEFDPQDKSAYASKSFSLRMLKGYPQAIEALNKAIELDPQYAWAYKQRGSIYHDDLFQYEAAYQDLKKAADIKDSQAIDRANLAEAALTSGRFEEAYNIATALLSEYENNATFSAADKLAARFIAISALLLEGKTAQAKPRLEEFTRYYKSTQPGLEQDWDYSGTQHFLEGRRMDRVSKSTMLDLIELLEQPPEIKIGLDYELRIIFT